MRMENDEKKDEKPGRLARIGAAIADVAPTLAGALGGPLAGAAAETLSRAVLGDAAESPPRALEERLLARDPAALLAARAAETEFRKAVLEAQRKAERIAAEDRASARERQVALKDRTPAILGFGVITGFFGVLGIMLAQELPAQAEPAFSIMLGALATMTAAVVNYYFGSSAGSREKTALLKGVR